MTDYLTPTELDDLGVTQEVNRQFFHPIGMQLEAIDGHLRVADHRADPAGVFFDDADLNTEIAMVRANTIANEIGERSTGRIEIAGSHIQPIPSNLRIWELVDDVDPSGEPATIRRMFDTAGPGVELGYSIDKCSWTMGDDGVWEQIVTAWTPLEQDGDDE